MIDAGDNPALLRLDFVPLGVILSEFLVRAYILLGSAEFASPSVFDGDWTTDIETRDAPGLLVIGDTLDAVGVDANTLLAFRRDDIGEAIDMRVRVRGDMTALLNNVGTCPSGALSSNAVKELINLFRSIVGVSFTVGSVVLRI